MAVTEGKLSGDIMGIYANGTLVAHATDSSLSVTIDVIDTTEKDSNKWVEHIKGNRGWEISGNSLEVFASSMSVEQLIDFLINAESVSVQFKTTNVQDSIYSGSVSVTATSFSAPQNAPAAFDFTFVGNGTLTRSGGSDEWFPTDLAKAERTLLSQWDATDNSTITEATGISAWTDKIASNDFAQTTGSDQPILTNGGTTDAVITFDGSNDFLDQVINSGNFQNLTRFEWWSVVYNDDTINNHIASFHDANGASAFARINLRVSQDGKLDIRLRDNGGTPSAESIADSVALNTGFSIVGIIFNGTDYLVVVNGTERNLGGSGKFIGDMNQKASVDQLSIGMTFDSSAFFRDDREKGIICFGGTDNAALSSAAERTNIFDYLNTHHNLGL